ncbi:uncharacterized protein LOC132197998 [Neocloeon triangulifer]|uniref:uncharacterized protein LOC132197998 n=1 Tax=Neocloeon triangulifer TaxID=2078957 RepID=UPI00286ED3D2|nr:uncharacterized protein LOC132197998 [Neocloeon triangulifer]
MRLQPSFSVITLALLCVAYSDARSTSNATNMILQYIDEGKIEWASNAFLRLPENRDELLAGIISKAYNGSTAKLLKVTKFADSVKYFNSEKIAFDTLYKEMEKNGHLSEKEVFYQYCVLSRISNAPFFKAQDGPLKNALLTLKSKFAAKKEVFLNSLALEIYQDYKNQKSKQVFELFQYSYSECFVPELVQKLMSSQSIEFKTIISHSLETPGKKQQCIYLEELKKGLESRGKKDSLEDLVVWTSAKYNLFNTTGGDLSSDRYSEKCKAIYEQPPISKLRFHDQYISKVAQGSVDDIKKWHQDYPIMRFFLADVIQSLPKDQVQKSNVNKWANFFEQLPLEDKCLSAKTLLDQLEKFSLLKGHEHFRIANVLMKNGEYNKFCSVVKDSLPRVFEQLISGKTGNCRLINRFYSEPLYCTSVLRSDELGRKIYTWVSKENAADQHWRVQIRPSDARVSFFNIERERQLRHVQGKIVRGGGNGLTDKDYFQLAAVDGDYLVIESSVENKRLLATSEECASSRRCVEMGDYEKGNTKFHWSLQCN